MKIAKIGASVAGLALVAGIASPAFALDVTLKTDCGVEFSGNDVAKCNDAKAKLKVVAAKVAEAADVALAEAEANLKTAKAALAEFEKETARNNDAQVLAIKKLQAVRATKAVQRALDEENAKPEPNAEAVKALTVALEEAKKAEAEAAEAVKNAPAKEKADREALTAVVVAAEKAVEAAKKLKADAALGIIPEPKVPGTAPTVEEKPMGGIKVPGTAPTVAEKPKADIKKLQEADAKAKKLGRKALPKTGA